MMPDVSFTELPGRRVLVCRFRPQDVAEFVAYRSDAEVARYQSWDAPYPQEQGERFVAEMMTAHPDTPGEWFQFAVALRATGQLIGDCAAMTRADDPRPVRDRLHDRSPVSGPRLCHRGGAPAGGLPVRPGQAPDHCLLRRAECGIGRRAGTAGHAREGHLRQSTWAKGEWTDDLLYALLHEEWQAG